MRTSHIRTNYKPLELCQRMCVWYEAMRRIGFTPDEIFFVPNVLDQKSGEVCYGIVVKLEEPKLEWAASIGRSTEDAESFNARWHKFMLEDVKNLTKEQVLTLWNKFMPLDLFNEISYSIRAKGLPLRFYEE